MSVIVWVTDHGWPAAVDAALRHSPSSDELLLLHVVAGEAEDVAHGGLAGLLGRPRREAGPAADLAATAAAAGELLDAARERAGNRLVRTLLRHGRPEREVVAAASGADLLVLCREGPDGLGPRVRFVLAQASCPVLLVWPEAER